MQYSIVRYDTTFDGIVLWKWMLGPDCHGKAPKQHGKFDICIIVIIADDVCIASAFSFVELVLNPTCTYHNTTPAIAKATPSNNNKSTRKSNHDFSQGGCPANKAFQGEREPANLKSGEGWKSKLIELQ